LSTTGFQPSNNDIMKSQNGFATYYDGYGWYPGDFTMNPGQGYLYLSNAATNKTLTYNISREMNDDPIREQTHWTPVTGFESTMSVTGVIIIDGVEQVSDQLEIGAFCGDECRGARIASYFPVTQQFTVPISIAGLPDDIITFRIYDHATETELDLDSNSTLTFEINGIVPPSGFNWFEFDFTSPVVVGVDELTEGKVKIYPNPTNDILYIEGAVDHCRCEIYTATGQLVYKNDNCQNKLKVDVSGIQPGAYIIKLMSADNIINKVFIKK